MGDDVGGGQVDGVGVHDSLLLLVLGCGDVGVVVALMIAHCILGTRRGTKRNRKHKHNRIYISIHFWIIVRTSIRFNIASYIRRRWHKHVAADRIARTDVAAAADAARRRFDAARSRFAAQRAAVRLNDVFDLAPGCLLLAAVLLLCRQVRIVMCTRSV